MANVGTILVNAETYQYYHSRDNAFNIGGTLAQARRAWLDEILYNLLLLATIISNLSDYNFIRTFSEELLKAKIQ